MSHLSGTLVRFLKDFSIYGHDNSYYPAHVITTIQANFHPHKYDILLPLEMSEVAEKEWPW